SRRAKRSRSSPPCANKGARCGTCSRRTKVTASRTKRTATCSISSPLCSFRRTCDELDDRFHPTRVSVQRRHEDEVLSADRLPLVARTDADLLDRLQAVGDERRTKHREPF